MSRRNRHQEEPEQQEKDEEVQVTSPKELMDACNENRQFWLRIGSSSSSSTKNNSSSPALLRQASLIVEKRYKDILAVAKDCEEFVSTTTTTKNKNNKKVDACEVDDVTYFCVMHECRSKLALLYLQRGNQQAASLLLERLGCRARLSDEIIRYTVPKQDNSIPVTDTKEEGCCFVDNLVSDSTFLKIQSVFCPEKAPYWTEHNYSVDPPSPYFSYVADLSQKEFQSQQQQQTILSELINTARNAASLKYPKVLREAKFCEIWAHNRPHFSGHQLHFDSDNEGRDGIRHPLATCVYVVSESEECGGPTLVTTQKLGDVKMAEKGWLCFPKPNRVFMFESAFLHGVIPGHLEAMIDAKNKNSEHDSTTTTVTISKEKNSISSSKNNNNLRRVTLMLAFWKEIEVRRNEKGAGAARPLPSLDSDEGKSKAAWLKTLLSKSNNQHHHHQQSENQQQQFQLRSPPPLTHVWVDVKNNQPWPKHAPIVSYEQAFQY
jgi:hypothetical protein